MGQFNLKRIIGLSVVVSVLLGAPCGRWVFAASKSDRENELKEELAKVQKDRKRLEAELNSVEKEIKDVSSETSDTEENWYTEPCKCRSDKAACPKEVWDKKELDSEQYKTGSNVSDAGVCLELYKNYKNIYELPTACKEAVSTCGEVKRKKKLVELARYKKEIVAQLEKIKEDLADIAEEAKNCPTCEKLPASETKNDPNYDIMKELNAIKSELADIKKRIQGPQIHKLKEKMAAEKDQPQNPTLVRKKIQGQSIKLENENQPMNAAGATDK